MVIKVSAQFEKHYKKLPLQVKEKAKERELLFRENPFHPQLKTHKLSGNNKGSWAFWVSYHIRIKFIFLDHEEILLLDIGTHNIY